MEDHKSLLMGAAATTVPSKFSNILLLLFSFIMYHESFEHFNAIKSSASVNMSYFIQRIIISVEKKYKSSLIKRQIKHY